MRKPVAAVTGDREFEGLFFEHYPRLVRTLVRLVGSAGQAEEIASDAFYRLYRHRGEHGSHLPDGNPAGWLYRTAVNLGLDALRANSRRSRREEKAQREETAMRTPGNPLFELLAEEQRERVRTAICRLKPAQGQVLLMGSSGFTCKEMAEMLGVKIGSLYVMISRAKAQFEKEYVNLYGRAE